MPEHKHGPGERCPGCEAASGFAGNTFTVDTSGDIPATNSILGYLSCAVCAEEKPKYLSYAEYSQLEAGVTPVGIQIRCGRHDLNLIHIDFDGHKPRANPRAK